MVQLARKTCVPCVGNIPALTGDQVGQLLADLDHWSAEKGHHLTKTFKFPDFARALSFVNQVGAIAEEQDHHPDIYLSWGRVRLDIWTHKIDGLTENDFILAAKIDELVKGTASA